MGCVRGVDGEAGDDGVDGQRGGRGGAAGGDLPRGAGERFEADGGDVGRAAGNEPGDDLALGILYNTMAIGFLQAGALVQAQELVQEALAVYERAAQ